jgi:hypothetical protein
MVEVECDMAVAAVAHARIAAKSMVAVSACKMTRESCNACTDVSHVSQSVVPK